MAVPDQQFQDIIDNIEKTVQETIQAELKKLNISPPSTLDLNLFREEVVADVRNELIRFREELLSGLTASIAEREGIELPPSDQEKPHGKTGFRLKDYW